MKMQINRPGKIGADASRLLVHAATLAIAIAFLCAVQSTFA
jgi:hypothetical protein